MIKEILIVLWLIRYKMEIKMVNLIGIIKKLKHIGITIILVYEFFYLNEIDIIYI
jgi:hypothetical protein